MKRESDAKRYYKAMMLIMLVTGGGVLSILLLVLLPIYLSESEINTTPMLLWMIIFITLTFLPFDIYYIVKFIHYKNVQCVKIQRGKVVDSDTYYFGRHGTYVGFKVEIIDEERRKVVTTLHCHRRADGYVGCIVTVGQDPTNGEWIILE